MVVKIWNDLMLCMRVITYEIAHAYMVPWYGIYEKVHACMLTCIPHHKWHEWHGMT
jgi:hypothetical protein